MTAFSRALAAMMLLAGAAIGGEARLDDVVKSMLSAMDRLTAAMMTIQDEDTAKAAHPDLKKGAEEWLVLRKRAESVPPPTREEKIKLEKDYKSKIEEAQKKLFAEIARVQTVPGGKEALQEVSKALDPKRR